jgi:outer membrane biosynthesis protein TonB
MRGDDRTDLKPSMLAALGLHVAVLASGLLVWPWGGKPVQIANVTAVTLTPSSPAPPPPALQAPETQTATAPEPTPKPQPPKPPPPKPQPTPTPVKPTPPPPKIDPKGIPKPAAAKPKPAEPDFLSSLTTSLDKSVVKPSAATKGPPRLETAPMARTDPGAAQATANAADAVGARLNRIWNKSCGVEGFRDVVIRVKFNLTPEGALQGVPQVMDVAQAGNSVWQAAADRAVRAVVQAAPFAELPRQTYGQWKTFTAIFNCKEACQNQ